MYAHIHGWWMAFPSDTKGFGRSRFVMGVVLEADEGKQNSKIKWIKIT